MKSNTVGEPVVDLATGGESCFETKQYRAGTLSYTKAGLITLFFWLLAGDFVFMFMETVPQKLFPLMLKDHGASNREIAIAVTAIAGILNSIINPIVSYRSDRTRGRWGRRIPYLVAATPFVVIFLVLIPFAPDITAALLRHPLAARLLATMPMAPVILVFGLLVALFQVFNLVISSIYFYLFRDVVPVEHMGKMWALFRIVSSVAAFIFNFWIFPIAEQHVKMVFVLSGLLYAIGFMLMCWKVREGGYPPVHDAVMEGSGFVRAIRNFVTESFAPIYCWIYIVRVFMMLYLVLGTFVVFFARDQLHLDYGTIGRVTAWPTLVWLLLAYPFGILIDRWGSIRSVGVAIALMFFGNLAGYFLISGKTSLLVLGIVIGTAWSLFLLGQSVLCQLLFHQERMGQLSSANAILVALSGVIAAPLCGALFDWIRDYRYMYLLMAIFSGASAFSLWKVWQHWHLCGGPLNYRAPLYNRAAA